MIAPTSPDAVPSTIAARNVAGPMSNVNRTESGPIRVTSQSWTTRRTLPIAKADQPSLRARSTVSPRPWAAGSGAGAASSARASAVTAAASGPLTVGLAEVALDGDDVLELLDPAEHAG